MIAVPGFKSGNPLEGEFMVPQDGHDQSDGEMAAKRWVIDHRFATELIALPTL